MNKTPDLMTKKDFAEFTNVSAARVSQWLKEGKIQPESLDGQGRRAKIKVQEALRNLEADLDISQRLGNGLGTKLDADEEKEPEVPTTNELIAQQKLFKAQAENQRLVEQELERRGIYTKTSDVLKGYLSVAHSMLRTFEGSIPDIAGAISAEFKLSQRDVQHVLKTQFRKTRERAAQVAQKQAATVPGTEEDRASLPELIEQNNQKQS